MLEQRNVSGFENNATNRYSIEISCRVGDFAFSKDVRLKFCCFFEIGGLFVSWNGFGTKKTKIFETFFKQTETMAKGTADFVDDYRHGSASITYGQ